MKRLRTTQLLIILCVSVAFSQVSTGTISGTVTDSTGAMVPDAQIVVLNEETGASRKMATDASGRYIVPLLNPGSYRVTATREGFQTEVRTGIALTVGREAVVDLSLVTGAISQTVEVKGEAPLVESTTASLGSLVDDRTICELPLNGRSYDQLALLQPGVVLTSPGQTGGAPFAFGTGKRFSVGGQRSTSNTFLLDGTMINDQANGTPGGSAGTNLGVDTILEFKIFTSAFKAEFGHSMGSVTSAITRSGTNTFHGTAFEYFRNSVLDARNFFDTGSSPPSFRRNQFGGVLGGPIRKDKTFFFVGYEGLRQGLATTLIAIVPNAAARQGILPTGKVPVSPAMVPYLNLYPLPNDRDFGDGTGEFISAPLVPTNEDNVMARVDHQLTSRTNIFGRYTFDTDSVSAQQSIPSVSLDQKSRRQYSTVQTNSTLSAVAVNSFRFAFNRSHSIYNPIISSSVPPELSIVPGQPLGALSIGGLITSGSRALASLGSPSSGSGIRYWAYNIFEWGDDFSYVVGRHTLKAGADIQRVRDNTASGNYLRGSYTFSSFQNFLAGIPSNLQAAAPLGVLPNWELRQTVLGFYAQDDYTVNSRLTLNLGLRWEAATDPVDARGQASVLPSPTATAMTPSSSYFNTGKKNFEPRLGLAWRLDARGKTVLRIGAGVYHNQILPWTYALNILNPPAYGRYSATNPPFPNGYQILKPGALLAVSTFTHLEKTPTDQQYNFSIQQQLSKSTMVQIAYAGNRAEHLETERESDTTVPTFTNGNLNNPFYPANTPRLNPAFAGILALEMNGNSRYNSVTITLKRQSSSGFQGQIFYTYSKSMDENSGLSNSDSLRSPQAVLNPFDIARDWGRADFDATHNMVANFSYALPFHAGSRLAGALVNGWTLDGIGTFSSGLPFTARLAASVSRDQSSALTERPNLNPGFSPNPSSGTSAGCPGFAARSPVGTVNNWYDPCAFSLPAAGTYGNLGRNTVIGPGIADVDLALEKSFTLRERMNATLKVEMFNVLNHANFGLPNTNALATNGTASPSAGLITYTTTSSRQLQFALRIGF